MNNDLIKITTGEQGSSVVSARELYNFLGFDASQWSRWSKKNIVNNGWAKEGEDWQRLDIMSNGNPTTDYALSLDFAKRLSMLARTHKGEEIRKYFIEKESQLRQTLTAPLFSTEQALIQLVSQQTQLLASLRADVDEIRAGYKPVRKRQSIQPPHQKQPALSAPDFGLRQLIHRKVNEYCGYHGVSQSETYNYLYKRLLDVYGVNVYRLMRTGGESLIDALERYGHLDRVYSLIMAELTYVEE